MAWLQPIVLHFQTSPQRFFSSTWLLQCVTIPMHFGRQRWWDTATDKWWCVRSVREWKAIHLLNYFSFDFHQWEQRDSHDIHMPPNLAHFGSQLIERKAFFLFNLGMKINWTCTQSLSRFLTSMLNSNTPSARMWQWGERNFLARQLAAAPTGVAAGTRSTATRNTISRLQNSVRTVHAA